jgi:hypothetical protein
VKPVIARVIAPIVSRQAIRPKAVRVMPAVNKVGIPVHDDGLDWMGNGNESKRGTGTIESEKKAILGFAETEIGWESDGIVARK